MVSYKGRNVKGNFKFSYHFVPVRLKWLPVEKFYVVIQRYSSEWFW